MSSIERFERLRNAALDEMEPRKQTALRLEDERSDDAQPEARRTLPRAPAAARAPGKGRAARDEPPSEPNAGEHPRLMLAIPPTSDMHRAAVEAWEALPPGIREAITPSRILMTALRRSEAQIVKAIREMPR